MAGYDETALLPTRHVVSQLLLRRQGEELPCKASHLRYHARVDSVIHHLKHSPVLARLHDLPADLRSTVLGVDLRKRYDGNLIAELVVSYLRALVFVSDEAFSESLLLSCGWQEWHFSRSHFSLLSLNVLGRRLVFKKKVLLCFYQSGTGRRVV